MELGLAKDYRNFSVTNRWAVELSNLTASLKMIQIVINGSQIQYKLTESYAEQ